jgi:hypothetical protein
MKDLRDALDDGRNVGVLARRDMAHFVANPCHTPSQPLRSLRPQQGQSAGTARQHPRIQNAATGRKELPKRTGRGMTACHRLFQRMSVTIQHESLPWVGYN